MKATINLLLLVTISSGALAQNEKYIEQMSKHIQAIYVAETPEQYQDAINTFERIAAAEKIKWEPYYYSAFGWLMMANKEKEATTKDAYIDKAMSAIENGKNINGNESELIALEGFANMIRVSVDPATRGPQYSGLAFKLYSKALAINPENPRALAFVAQLQMRMAKFMGSPTTEACEGARKSLEKYSTYKSENPLAPVWGKGMTERLLENCK